MNYNTLFIASFSILFCCFDDNAYTVDNNYTTQTLKSSMTPQELNELYNNWKLAKLIEDFGANTYTSDGYQKSYNFKTDNISKIVTNVELEYNNRINNILIELNKLNKVCTRKYGKSWNSQRQVILSFDVDTKNLKRAWQRINLDKLCDNKEYECEVQTSDGKFHKVKYTKRQTLWSLKDNWKAELAFWQKAILHNIKFLETERNAIVDKVKAKAKQIYDIYNSCHYTQQPPEYYMKQYNLAIGNNINYKANNTDDYEKVKQYLQTNFPHLTFEDNKNNAKSYNEHNYYSDAIQPQQQITQGTAESKFQLGLMHERQQAYEYAVIDYYEAAINNHKTALERLNYLAENGNAEAQYVLGYIYVSGLTLDGVKYTDAQKWYQKAANQGHPAAKYCLGLMYERGDGVQQNYEQAIKWYYESAIRYYIAAFHKLNMLALNGIACAQTTLGYMFLHGYGVAQNYPEAVKWYQMAASQGDQHAIALLNDLANKR